ncbi:hypothetical protein HK104_001505 [Borealophlyctis nickersoniae]|nr:hypothetical protein HK104_001505 [Borealophlyctis nickersoniae]
MDRQLHLALHEYYDPTIHNVAYLALVEEEGDVAAFEAGDVSTNEEEDMLPTEEDMLPALIILVSHMPDRRHDQRTAVQIAGGESNFAETLMLNRGPIMPGNSISSSRYPKKQVSLNSCVEVRMRMDAGGLTYTSWTPGYLTCAHGVAFPVNTYPTEEEETMLTPVISLDEAMDIAAAFCDEPDVLSRSTPAYSLYSLQDPNVPVERHIGRIATGVYKHDGNRMLDCCIMLEHPLMDTSRLVPNSNTVPVSPMGSATNYVKVPLRDYEGDISDLPKDSVLFKAGLATGVTRGALGILQEITWGTHTSHEWTVYPRADGLGVANSGDSGAPVYGPNGEWIGLIIANVGSEFGVFTPISVIRDYFERTSGIEIRLRNFTSTS